MKGMIKGMIPQEGDVVTVNYRGELLFLMKIPPY
jgi:FKBP-type peptidyl-prolyl cis-trans isomerase